MTDREKQTQTRIPYLMDFLLSVYIPSITISLWLEWVTEHWYPTRYLAAPIFNLSSDNVSDEMSFHVSDAWKCFLALIAFRQSEKAGISRLHLNFRVCGTRHKKRKVCLNLMVMNPNDLLHRLQLIAANDNEKKYVVILITDEQRGGKDIQKETNLTFRSVPFNRQSSYCSKT